MTPLLIALATVASPTPQTTLQVSRATAPLIELGTYHWSTGTWSRASTSTALGPDVLYNNTGPFQYFVAVTDHSQKRFEIIDEGRIPSISDTGDGDRYEVSGISFAYCSSAGLSQALVFESSIHEDYEPCSRLIGAATGTIQLSGLPSSATVGVQACWALTIDLEGSTLAFEMAADADGVFDGSMQIDSFGYTVSFSGQGADSSTGPLLFGDPYAYPHGDGTTNFGYGPGPAGTGLGQHDLYWIEREPLSWSGCYWSGSYPVNPWHGIYYRVHGDSTEPDSPVAYCLPTSANSVSPLGATLNCASGFGTDTASFDLAGVPDRPGLLFAGPTTSNQLFGCGRLCVAGPHLRGPVVTPTGHQLDGAVLDMSTAHAVEVQYWYRDPANFSSCGFSWNLSNALMP